MIAVLFFVELPLRAKTQYLQLAAPLAEELAQFDGFVSVQRFQALASNVKVSTKDGQPSAADDETQQLLSLSLWRDEAAVAAWRAHTQHQQAQHIGRNQLFRHYRILVTEVLRDYSMHADAATPMGVD